MAVAANYAYVADGGSGLRVINVANLVPPVEVGFNDTPGEANGRGCGGELRLCRRRGRRAARRQRDEPSRATEVGFYDTPGDAHGVAVAGSYAYVADGSAGCASSTWRTRPRRSRSATTTRQGMPMAWRWRATTPTSPMGPAGCASSTWRTRPRREVGFYDTPGYAYGRGGGGQLRLRRRWLPRAAHHQRRQPGRADRGRVLRHAGVCPWRGGGGQLRLRRRLQWWAACDQRRQSGRASRGRFLQHARVLPMAWRWRAATPTSPMVAAGCASSTWPTRPPRRGGFYDTPGTALWRGRGGELRLRRRLGSRAAHHQRGQPGRAGRGRRLRHAGDVP